MSAADSACTSARKRDPCYDVLKAAVRKAEKESGYDSTAFRASQFAEVEEMFGYLPYEYQVDVGEAQELCLDCILRAGTGAGKTLTFIMKLVHRMQENKMVLIMSPLNELQRDQVSSWINPHICAFLPCICTSRLSGLMQ